MNTVQQPYLPLRDAVLCTECNFISTGESGKCPVCRGSVLLKVGDLVKADVVNQDEPRRNWLKVQDVLLGIRRRPRQRDLGYATRY